MVIIVAEINIYLSAKKYVLQNESQNVCLSKCMHYRRQNYLINVQLYR